MCVQGGGDVRAKRKMGLGKRTIEVFTMCECVCERLCVCVFMVL